MTGASYGSAGRGGAIGTSPPAAPIRIEPRGSLLGLEASGSYRIDYSLLHHPRMPVSACERRANLICRQTPAGNTIDTRSMAQYESGNSIEAVFALTRKTERASVGGTPSASLGDAQKTERTGFWHTVGDGMAVGSPHSGARCSTTPWPARGMCVDVSVWSPSFSSMVITGSSPR